LKTQTVKECLEVVSLTVSLRINSVLIVHLDVVQIVDNCISFAHRCQNTCNLLKNQ